MSEPVQKGEIDLKSLDQALNDGETASELTAETLERNSHTLAQSPADARSPIGNTSAAQGAFSPATLSPSSPRAMSPVATPAVARTTSDVPPAVTELKLMFPDLDNETIAAVLSSRGGNQDAAVNALLQMSDPNFKPSVTDSRTESDALLAQTIAMEEEQRQHEHWARRQQQQAQQQQQYSTGRGGGGAGTFFSGLLSSDARDPPSAPSGPSYDPNALTYQPRVRRGGPATSGTPASGARSSYAPPNHPPPGVSPTYEHGDSVFPGMPGAKEAKQWQEEINRMAETGLARAASTFSTFRQKASAAFNNPQDGAGQPGTASSGPGAGAGFSQAFNNFRNNTGRGFAASEQTQQATASTTSPRQFASPRSPHASEYDQDPSPVSENELAKIISRGGGAGGGSSNPLAAGKARALADRYGLGIKNSGRSGAGASPSRGGSTDASEFAGWDQAGRTPISITDNTGGSKVGGADKQKDSIALMDSASGRGITSPRLDRSPTKETPSTGAASKTLAAGVAGGAAVGAGTAAIALGSHDANDPNDDSDDLEYVSNPFEDED